jgi:response regulator RpfG family c-di-GMP phosphodiesterase
MTQRRILIVDDEEEVRSAISRVLERDGYRVVLAEDGEQGQRILQEQPIHLVISDHHMPGMKGIEFLKATAERHPEVVRMIMSGDPDNRVVIRSIREGRVFWFLRKPWDNTVLRVVVYLAFQRRELEEQNRQLLSALGRQLAFLQELEAEFPELRARARGEAQALRAAQGATTR